MGNLSFTSYIKDGVQVRWSPFMESLFLSCSSDWTVRLWSEDQVSTSAKSAVLAVKFEAVL